MTTSIISLILLIAGADLCLGNKWSYANIDYWPGICKTGKFQSPIDLDNAVENDFNPFFFTNYDVEYNSTAKNTGHSIVVSLDMQDERPTVKGASLPQEYTLDQFHFHWESEHTRGGRRFPLELHLLHYATQHGDVAKALQFPNGVMVLGVLFELTPDADADIKPLMEVMSNIQKTPNQETPLLKLIKPNHFLPRDKGGFYRYVGSLTTPGCNEGIIWTIFTNTLRLSARQIKHFNAVYSSNGPLIANYRPIQETNGRIVAIKRSPIGSSANMLSISSITLVLTMLILNISY